jgi:hypothetical protein
MLHLTHIEPPSDTFRLDRSRLFAWDQNVAKRASAFGKWLANLGLSAPLVMGAIAGTAHMLATYWEAECGRTEREARQRADRFAALALEAWRTEAERIVSSEPKLH